MDDRKEGMKLSPSSFNKKLSKRNLYSISNRGEVATLEGRGN